MNRTQNGILNQRVKGDGTMNWTAQRFLDWSSSCLDRAGVDNPRLDSEVLLAEVLKSSREHLLIAPRRELTEQEHQVYKNFVERRARWEPVSYILEKKEFWSLEFKVTPDVLVPRPETEVLLERFLDLITASEKDRPFQILDIGTGTGNIAVAVAKELSRAMITAVDNSKNALDIAGENARTHQVSDRIRFVHADLMDKDCGPVYDFILSNPPYIETRRLDHLMTDVRAYEPRQALDGGPGGRDFYKRIIPRSFTVLKDGGSLLMEIGEDQAQRVSEIFRAHGGDAGVEVFPDYSGRDRIISAKKILQVHG